MGDTRVEHGHHVQRLDHVGAVLAGQGEIGFEMELTAQALDLFQDLGGDLGRVTARMQQGQHQGREFVAQRDAGEAQARFRAAAQDREGRHAVVGFRTFGAPPGDFVRQLGDIAQQGFQVPRRLDVVQGGDELDGLAQILQIAFQLGLQGLVQHGPVFRSLNLRLGRFFVSRGPADGTRRP